MNGFYRQWDGAALSEAQTEQDNVDIAEFYTRLGKRSRPSSG